MFDENSRQISKWVENTVGKGEIARYEKFRLFLECFQKTCTAEQTRQNQGLFGKELKKRCVRETLVPTKRPFFFSLKMTLIMKITLADDLDYGTKEKILPQRKHM